MSILLLAAALIQTPPLSPVTFDAPASLTSRNTFDCQGRQVELDLSATSWASRRPSGVRVTKYRSGDRTLNANHLEQWNQQLEPIKIFLSNTLQCQSGNRELITLQGNDAEGRRIALHFRMENGALISLGR